MGSRKLWADTRASPAEPAASWTLALASAEVAVLVVMLLLGPLLMLLRRGSRLVKSRLSLALVMSWLGSAATLYAPLRTIVGGKGYNCVALVMWYYCSMFLMVGAHALTMLQWISLHRKQQQLYVFMDTRGDIGEVPSPEGSQLGDKYTSNVVPGLGTIGSSDKLTSIPSPTRSGSHPTSDAIGVFDASVRALPTSLSPETNSLIVTARSERVNSSRTSARTPSSRLSGRTPESARAASVVSSARSEPSTARSDVKAADCPLAGDDPPSARSGAPAPMALGSVRSILKLTPRLTGSAIQADVQPAHSLSPASSRRRLESARNSLVVIREAHKEVLLTTAPLFLPPATYAQNGPAGDAADAFNPGNNALLDGLSVQMPVQLRASRQIYRPTSFRATGSGLANALNDIAAAPVVSIEVDPGTAPNTTVVGPGLHSEDEAFAAVQQVNAPAKLLCCSRALFAGNTQVWLPVMLLYWGAAVAVSLGVLSTCNDVLSGGCSRMGDESLVSFLFVGLSLCCCSWTLLLLRRFKDDVFSLTRDVTLQHGAFIIFMMIYYGSYLSWYISGRVLYEIETSVIVLGMTNAVVAFILPGLMSHQNAWAPSYLLNVSAVAVSPRGTARCADCDVFKSFCWVASTRRRSSAASSVSSVGRSTERKTGLGEHNSLPSTHFAQAKARSSLIVTESRSHRHVLEELLHDSLGRKLLAAHLKREFSLENLLFFLEVQKFRHRIGAQLSGPQHVDNSARVPTDLWPGGSMTDMSGGTDLMLAAREGDAALRSLVSSPMPLDNAGSVLSVPAEMPAIMNANPPDLAISRPTPNNAAEFSLVGYAAVIYSRYLADGSPFQITVSHGVLHDVRSQITFALKHAMHEPESESRYAMLRKFEQRPLSSKLMLGRHNHVAREYPFLSPKLFDQLQQDVHDVIMRDALPRFMESDAYAWWMKQQRMSASVLTMHRKDKPTPLVPSLSFRKIEGSPVYKKSTVVPVGQ